MAFCNSGEFLFAKVGNFICNSVHFYYAINRQVLYSYATAIIADKPLLPLPELEEKTLSAEQIGKILGISANMVGRIANKHNLKTEQYGKWFHDKSRYSNKEVQSFRYYESVIPVIKAILSREVCQ